MPETLMRRLNAGFFPAILLLFMTSFFLPVSAKTSNNIFYAGLGLPALIWWLRAPRAALGPYSVAPAFFVCLGLFALALGVGDAAFLKDALYVVALFLACVMVERNDGAVRRVFLLFAVVGVALLAAAALEWAVAVRFSGVAPRIVLWGRAENPIFAALMIISGLVFVWVFHLEERLARHSDAARWGGLLVLAAFCVACGVVFQARSALVGFAFFLAGYALQRRLLVAVSVVLAVVGLALVASGGVEILLERGFSYRIDIWEAALRRVSGECGLLAGCGKDQFRILGQFYHPHSAYVSALYYGGLPSLAAFSAMAAVFLVVTWRARSSWLLVALVGWGGLVTESSGVITSPRTLWVFFWIPVFMALIESGRPILNEYYRRRAGAVTRPG